MGRAVVIAQLLQGAILLKLDTSEGQQSGVAPLKAWKRMAVDGSRVGWLIRLAMICFNHQPFMSAHQPSISGGVALPQFLVGSLFGAGRAVSVMKIGTIASKEFLRNHNLDIL